MGRSSRTGGLIRTKSGESSRNRESLPAAKNNTSKHEKQRRSNTRNPQLHPKREIQSADANLPSSSDESLSSRRKREATRSKGKIARIQAKQIENRLRKSHRTHARTRKNTHLSPSQPLPRRRARGSEHPPAGRSTQRADGAEGEGLGALWWWRLRFLSRSGSWTGSSGERKGGEGKEARQGKRGRNGC